MIKVAKYKIYIYGEYGYSSRLAQLVEHRSYEPKVKGSIPLSRTQSGKLLGEASAFTGGRSEFKSQTR